MQPKETFICICNVSWLSNFLYLYGEVLLCFKSMLQQQVGSVIADVWGKNIVSTLRKERITCGPWKEFGKAKEACHMEIGQDEEQRYIPCCVLPSAVSCLHTRASSFPWCSPWKYPVETEETLTVLLLWNSGLCNQFHFSCWI